MSLRHRCGLPLRWLAPTCPSTAAVLAVVVEEDTSRVVWPSCPAKGWVHGVNRLSGLPNGSPAGLVPRNDNTQIEVQVARV